MLSISRTFIYVIIIEVYFEWKAYLETRISFAIESFIIPCINTEFSNLSWHYQHINKKKYPLQNNTVTKSLSQNKHIFVIKISFRSLETPRSLVIAPNPLQRYPKKFDSINDVYSMRNSIKITVFFSTAVKYYKNFTNFFIKFHFSFNNRQINRKKSKITTILLITQRFFKKT